jgi:hypothetical protein
MFKNYSDLLRTDVAVYSCKGYTIFIFNKARKELEIAKGSHMCYFVESDFRSLANYFENCYLFSTGVLKDISHTVIDEERNG